jgi:hypothetical protein
VCQFIFIVRNGYEDGDEDGQGAYRDDGGGGGDKYVALANECDKQLDGGYDANGAICRIGWAADDSWR